MKQALYPIYYFLLFIFLTPFANAQDKKLSIGLVFSPEYCKYDFIQYKGQDHLYKTKINYSAGLRIQYYFTKRISLKSGALYAIDGYTVEWNWKALDPLDPAIPKNSGLKLIYLDIPLMVSYNFINRNKISLFSSIGVSIDFLINNKEFSIMADGSKKETSFLNQHLNSTRSGIVIDLGLKYNITTKLFITLEPYFKYGLSKFDNEVLASNPVSFGATIGVHFNLK